MKMFEVLEITESGLVVATMEVKLLSCGGQVCALFVFLDGVQITIWQWWEETLPEPKLVLDILECDYHKTIAEKRFFLV